MQLRPHVAVVDDDEAMCRALERLLRAADFEVVTFGTGSEALAAMSARAPDCAVVDIELPDFRGLDLFASLRAIHPTLPVIVITAWEDEALRLRAYAAGVAGFFYKPFHEQPFLSCLLGAIAVE